jgi:hypothetical protein
MIWRYALATFLAVSCGVYVFGLVWR